MIEIFKNLCELDATSGDENSVREFIISKIDGFCEYKTDALGNILVFKKGKKKPQRKVMLDAHTDEVGIIITAITADGYLKFQTVGGIDVASIMFRRVKIDGRINGVISGKPIHLTTAEQRKKLPKVDSLYIDIGASSKLEASEKVSLGDRGVICGEYSEMGDNIISKAIDDRAGCAVLIDLIRSFDEYDFYASFSSQEEIGLRGAKTAAFAIDPDCAIILESTTAADIADVKEENSVCNLKSGPVISFMDRATVYDRMFYDAALKSGILCQPKRAVAGGNNAGSVHLSREGVRTIAISLPTRYIHSSSCVANKSDLQNMRKLAEYMLKGIASGEIE